ncbi:non-ribosomal peptide synthetase, partial [Paenibacillus radicis (ex Gao et al. 2016)]
MEQLRAWILEQLSAKAIAKEEAKKLLLALEHESQSAIDDDIAVIGMSCRTAGAETLEAFWDNIAAGKSFIDKLPAGRLYDLKNYFDSGQEEAYRDKTMEELRAALRYGGYMKDIDKFDADFFGLSEEEVLAMDPYQRIMLECCMEAIENAGAGGDYLRGTRTGIFIGRDQTSHSIYRDIIDKETMLSTVGNYASIVASRLAYLSDFRGPAMVVDTACSSGLVAVHLACQSIRSKECQYAIAGGINIDYSPIDRMQDVEYKSLTSDSPMIRTFDKASSGTLWGDGAAVVLLKPLRQAILDRDPIQAVIKGSAVNNDGASNGILAPNADAQTEVIISAWQTGNIEPEHVSYMECHGTGTIIGDPIEVKGISNAFKPYTSKKQFCALSALKPNISHVLAPSGVLALIKVILAMKHKQLPPTLHFEEPNPYMQLSDSPVYINDQLAEWKSDVPRTAGVSAFGFSGTNCHVVVQQFEQQASSKGGSRLWPFVVSAKNEESFKRLLLHYRDYLNDSIDIGDLCYTAATGRGHYDYRLAIVVRSISELKQQLGAFIDGGFVQQEEAGLLYEQSSSRMQKKETDSLSKLANALAGKLYHIDAEALPGRLSLLCNLYVQGAKVDWASYYRMENRRRIELPIYPFQRNRYWAGAHMSYEQAAAAAGLLEEGEKEEQKEAVFELSHTQKAMWFLQRMNPESTAYNLEFISEMNRQLDTAAFQEALNTVIRRHAVFRTVFTEIDGHPFQVIKNRHFYKLEVVDCSREHDPSAAIAAARDKLRYWSFDLSQPLLLAKLFKKSETSYIVYFNIHHLIFDATSAEILMQELLAYYESFAAGGTPLVAPTDIRFVDWVQSQAAWEQSEEFHHSERYWLSNLGGTLPVLELPVDNARPDVLSYRGDHIFSQADAELTEQILAAAKRLNCSANILLMACYFMMLHRISGEEDLIVGFPFRGRETKQTEQLIGLFINMISLRVQLEPDMPFVQLLKRIMERNVEAIRHRKYPFDLLVTQLNPVRTLNRNPIFSTAFFYYHMYENQTQGVSLYDLSLSCKLSNSCFEFNLTYSTDLFQRQSAEQFMAYFIRIVNQVTTNPNVRLSEADVLSEREKQRLLHEFNATAADFPREQTIHGLFEAQAARIPDQTAVSLGNESLTFGELNAKANRLARTLRTAGAGADSLVGLMAERSLDMMVAVMAILKAGGAYVPFDPAHPEARIRYMLEDSGAKLLLTQARLRERVSFFTGQVILLEDETAYASDSSDLEAVSGPEQLAYVIYTSGTTGQPKGVMIEHHAVVNRLHWMQKAYPLTAGDCLLQKTPITFDVSVWELFWWAIAGQQLRLLPPQGEKDPRTIAETIAKGEVTVIHFVPSMFQMFLHYVEQNEGRGLRQLASLKTIFVSGEALPLSQAEAFYRIFGERVQLVNLYGPTEATVDVSHLRCEPGMTRMTIGKPIDNHRLLIVNTSGQLQPIGVTGELCIAGEGLARGYLNRPELTEEKFAASPLAGGERMYRTGDLARWLPDGHVEYRGRMDHQVKIRGYRMELGEIESQLLKHDDVQQAVVLDKTDSSGHRYLCAYIAANREMFVSQWRTYLSASLPEYMIPAQFIQVEEVPLTPNGKADRKALRQLDIVASLDSEYVAPQSEKEMILSKIWRDVLGGETIGIHDRFFDLGGDSIKSIQVSSRLYQAGYKLELKDLFQFPTIAQLAQRIQAVSRMADQGDVTGETKLTPIQCWLFEQKWAKPSHYNQAMLLHRADGFDEAAICKAINALTVHHDALRLVFLEAESGIVSRNRAVGEGESFSFECIDLRETEGIALAIEEQAERLQQNMELGAGPLIKAALFRCKDGDHLLLVIHHLVVDGVSWRILFEDLSSGYEQARESGEIKLAEKTDSFQLWASSMHDYANAALPQEEREYWQAVERAEHQRLPRDREGTDALVRDGRVVSIQLDEADTFLLLRRAHHAYNTEVNDLLLTGLGLAMQGWAGLDSVMIALEGHGREKLGSDVDVFRTVGWFTSLYPFLLNTGAGSGLRQTIKKVKESLRRVPRKGIGYGLLRYAAVERSGDEAYVLQPEVCFNYLGQFDEDFNQSGMVMSNYGTGATSSPNNLRPYLLDINGIILGGRLHLMISYSPQQYEQEHIERLADLFKENLEAVIRHCASQAQAELTPGDVLVKGISIEDLEQLVQQTKPIGEVENVYPLTPMQKGMLLHRMLNPHSGAYFEQSTMDLRGHLDEEAFRQSLDRLAQRHEVLRTNIYGGWKEALQVVFRSKQLVLRMEDARSIAEERLAAYLEEAAAADREEGFDLNCDALMRITVIRTGYDHYRLLWSFHHIVMDGWCLPVVYRELFDIYYALLTHREPQHSPVTPYSHFIQWLEEQDDAAASRYWTGYLTSYENQTLLPYANKKLSGDENDVPETRYLTIAEDLSESLHRLARKQQTTLNIVMQTAWGLLLQKYNGSTDTVFGSVVSGRPAVLPNVEQMVGLFINTVPVRIRQEQGERVAELIRRTQDDAVASARHQSYPLYQIQSDIGMKQELVNHILVFENYPMSEQMEGQMAQEHGIEIANVAFREQTNYDFNVTIIPGQKLTLGFQYNASVFEAEDVIRIGSHWIHLLQQIADNPDLAVEALELITEDEKTVIKNKFNATAADFPREQTIHGLLEAQAARIPEQTAVSLGSESLTYGELNAKANRLARTLRDTGVGADSLVGLMADRSLDMIVAVMAILKAGGAYVPFDPAHPEARIRYMLEDSGAKLLLTQAHLKERVSFFTGQMIALEDEAAYASDSSDLDAVSGPEHLAYVIYTSGTTGQPKGVMIEHHSVVNRLHWMQKAYPLTDGDVLLQKTPVTFDVSVWELFWWAFAGQELRLLPPQGEKDPRTIAETIAKGEV